MNIDYEKLMASKSDEALQVYITDRAKYKQEAFDAAIAEMQKRGMALPHGDELNVYKEEFRQKKIQEEIAVKESDAMFSHRTENIVADADAPELYSERVLWAFTVFFGVLFGSVMLALNLKRVNKTKGIPGLILFGVLFTALTIILRMRLPQDQSNSQLTWVFNALGALVLKLYFWNRYIGKETKYRTRQFWVPLIIGVVMTAAVFAAAMYA